LNNSFVIITQLLVQQLRTLQDLWVEAFLLNKAFDLSQVVFAHFDLLRLSQLGSSIALSPRLDDSHDSTKTFLTNNRLVDIIADLHLLFLQLADATHVKQGLNGRVAEVQFLEQRHCLALFESFYDHVFPTRLAKLLTSLRT
jgi:hypothetical protein